MNWFGRTKTKEAPPTPPKDEAPPQTFVVPPPAPKPSKLLLAHYNMRRGMWVMYKDAIGILTDLNSEGVAKVMLVDNKGLNKLEVVCRAENLRQAYIQEIPQARVPNHRLLIALGYKEKQ